MSGACPVLRYGGQRGHERHSRESRRFSGRNVHPEGARGNRRGGSVTRPSPSRSVRGRGAKRTQGMPAEAGNLNPPPTQLANHHAIPAQADASADGTSIQDRQRPRHSRAQASSFPRTREPRINKARLFTPSRRPLQNPRHSRAGGRFSGRNIHPESTTPPSFPRPSLVIPAHAGHDESIKHAFSPHPGDHCKTPVIPAPKPRHSRGRGNPESIKHAFPPSRRPLQNPRHSRGRNLHPESTTPPSFPRPSPVIPADAGTQHQQSTPFHPIPATTTVPFARRGWTNP